MDGQRLDTLIHTHNGILFSHKEESPDICDNMDELGGHYAKRNKPDKDKLCMVSFTCVISKKEKKTNLQKQRLEGGFQGLGGRENGEIKVKAYKMPVTR